MKAPSKSISLPSWAITYYVDYVDSVFAFIRGDCVDATSLGS